MFQLNQVRFLESSSQHGSRTRSSGRHSNERDRDILRQLKEAHNRQAILEDQLKVLSKKYKESEHLIAEKDKRISNKEKEYYKACSLVRELLRTHKQMKKEIIELRGDTDCSGDTGSETQSQSGSLQLPAVFDANMMVDVDRSQEVIPISRYTPRTYTTTTLIPIVQSKSN